jgi:hypothetical protein
LRENCTKFIVRNGLALELHICGSLSLSSDWEVLCSPFAADSRITCRLRTPPPAADARRRGAPQLAAKARLQLPPIRTGFHPKIPGGDRPAQWGINSQASGADNGISGGG